MRLRKIISSKLFKLLFVLLILFVGYRLIVKPRLLKREVPGQIPAPTKPAKATTQVGRSFEFPAAKVGKKGEEEVTFTIVSAELKDEIRVKGAQRKADKGKLFLLLKLEIENETPDRLSLTSSDFVRLVGEAEKKFAPDFHNATIIIDPLSVRKDLVSFIVEEKIKSFKFLVGELEEEKETVEVSF